MWCYLPTSARTTTGEGLTSVSKVGEPYEIGGPESTEGVEIRRDFRHVFNLRKLSVSVPMEITVCRVSGWVPFRRTTARKDVGVRHYTRGSNPGRVFPRVTSGTVQDQCYCTKSVQYRLSLPSVVGPKRQPPSVRSVVIHGPVSGCRLHPFLVWGSMSPLGCRWTRSPGMWGRIRSRREQQLLVVLTLTGPEWLV